MYGELEGKNERERKWQKQNEVYDKLELIYLVPIQKQKTVKERATWPIVFLWSPEWTEAGLISSNLTLIGAQGLREERICLQCRRRGFHPWVEKIPGGGHGSPPQYSCLENSHGQKSLVGYSPWGCRVGHDWATKRAHTHTHTHTHTPVL